jgi:hypothetical protein
MHTILALRRRVNPPALLSAPDEASRRSPLSLFGYAQNKGVAMLPSRPPDFVSSHYLNLSLAARRCVGHIGLNGDVAEWLKAAVC